ncbi:hypothetical protein ED92_10625 [Amycolatopsis sp. MJM2582]|nr:hypothetical protein ED92_10625 [Amycolatopsis sp. MJM2582]
MAERLLIDPAEFGGVRLAGVAFSGLSVPHQDPLFTLSVPVSEVSGDVGREGTRAGRVLGLASRGRCRA